MNFGSDSYLRMFGSEAPGCDQIVGTADRVVHKKHSATLTKLILQEMKFQEAFRIKIQLFTEKRKGWIMDVIH